MRLKRWLVVKFCFILSHKKNNPGWTLCFLMLRVVLFRIFNKIIFVLFVAIVHLNLSMSWAIFDSIVIVALLQVMTDWRYQISLNSLCCYNIIVHVTLKFLHLSTNILTQLHGDISWGKRTAEDPETLLQQQHDNTKLGWWLRFVYLTTQRTSSWKTVTHTYKLRLGPLWQNVLDFTARQARRRKRTTHGSGPRYAEKILNEVSLEKHCHGDRDRNMTYS